MRTAANRFRHRRLIILLLLTLLVAVLVPLAAHAQAKSSLETLSAAGTPPAPTFWYVLAAALALLVPAGLVLIGVAGLEPGRAWDAALGAVGAIGLAGIAYWAIGFALQFGGVGLTYLRPEVHNLVWEWSPLPATWGVGWGVAGLSGWFLAGSDMTALSYALFFGHLPWVFTAAILPVLALRGRAAMIATLILALCIGGFVYPLAGNWVQGGGWLGALGRNLNLGHGFVDAGGAGTVFLVVAAFTLAALVVWAPRRSHTRADNRLPPAYQPLLSVVGSLLLLGGLTGWLWSNPLQVEALSDLALLRGSTNLILAAAAGVIAPLLYTWFVSGASSAPLAARGLAAGAVAGLALAPFVQPGPALLTGLIAGATVPFVSYILTNIAGLDDDAGVVSMAGLPAVLGLLMVGLLADGASGSGWQITGVDRYLGVAGQGISGLLVMQGFQPDFPGQLQAQVVGVLALLVWGFLMGLLLSAPLGLLFHSLQRSAGAPSAAERSADAELAAADKTLGY